MRQAASLCARWNVRDGALAPVIIQSFQSSSDSQFMPLDRTPGVSNINLNEAVMEIVVAGSLASSS
jgi:tRNA A22 N-methylase